MTTPEKQDDLPVPHSSFMKMARDDLLLFSSTTSNKKKRQHTQGCASSQKDFITPQLMNLITKETSLQSKPPTTASNTLPKTASDQVMLIDERKKEALHCYLRACCMRIAFERVFSS